MIANDPTQWTNHEAVLIDNRPDYNRVVVAHGEVTVNISPQNLIHVGAYGVKLTSDQARDFANALIKAASYVDAKRSTPCSS